MTRVDGSFESWSETLPQLAGCSAEDMPRTTRAWLQQRVHPEDREKVGAASLEAVRTRAKVELEYRLVRPDGAVVHVTQVIEPLQGTAEVGGLHWFSTLQDVTPQKTAEAAMRSLNEELERRVALRTAQLEASNRELLAATRAAEQANQAKSEFLSRMSHELRTPLNAIVGFSQLMSSPQHGLPAERQAAFNAHIHKAGEHLLALTSELLNLAQVEAGKLKLDMQPLSLAGLLAECEGMVTPLAQTRGVAMRLTTPPEPLTVVADRTRLKQVLLNLLSNAVKYNRAGGTLDVHTARSGDDRVRIDVCDSGMGLSPQEVAQLFQPFNRLRRADTEVEGTGLGLVVTKHLVELMGGRIGVASAPGAGSRFWVELAGGAMAPNGLPAVVPTAGPTSANRDDGPCRTVLLVDDDLPSQDLAQAHLRDRPDLRLIIAANGREGIALALAHAPAVILMDNRMPELSGGEAIELLAHDPRTAGIPVIAISAGPDLTPGSGHVLRRVMKPLAREELLDAIDAAIYAERRPRE